MPSTVRYATGYPSSGRPLNSSVSFSNDGLVTVSASFLLEPSSTTLLAIGQSLSPAMFPTIAGIALQASALFIAARSIEKRGGLITLNLTALGALNPPIFERSSEVGARGFSKSLTNEDGDTTTFSFDYVAQTNTATCVVLDSARVDVLIPDPSVQDVYNRNGSGIILSSNDDIDEFDSGQYSLKAQPRILTTTSNTFLVQNLVRRTISKQFVYE
jgi:hypothetical protein